MNQIPMSKFSQQQKILNLMVRNKDHEWWLPSDFMKPELGDLFVGYEASARLSELAKEYPEAIETRPMGKYKQRRLRLEDIDNWLPLLPKDLRYVIHRSGIQVKMDAPVLEEPVRRLNYTARLKRKVGALRVDQTHEIEVDRLVIGEPVKVRIEGMPAMEYEDIAAFQRDWSIV